MKTAKIVLSTALVMSTFLTACSSPNLPTNSNGVVAEQKIANTENTEMSANEVAEINKLIASSNIKADNTFSVMSDLQGKDIQTDILLQNPKAANRAKFWGLKTADKLLNAGTSPTKRWFLTRKLGGLFPSQAFKSDVLFWLTRADLLRIKGVSLDDSYLLAAVGVNNVAVLAASNNIISQASLLVDLGAVAFTTGRPMPSLSEIKSWTSEATRTANVLY